MAQDPAYNTCEEHALSDDEFENFIFRRVSPVSRLLRHFAIFPMLTPCY